jgi:signal transduction histidine kinase
VQGSPTPPEMHILASQPSGAPSARHEPDVAERMRWLLHLRWLIVPIFVAVDLASDLLLGDHAPWSAIIIGAALLAANGVYAALLARRHDPATLLRWARFESAFVVSIPMLVTVLHHDPASPVRFGVLVGVVGAAVVLPRTAEVALIGVWACASLVGADLLALGFDLSRVTHPLVARWAMESGVIVTVAIIAGYLHQLRARAEAQLRSLLEESERGRIEWEATFDNLADSVIIVDRGGVVLRVNRAFANALGAREQDLAGRRLDAVLAGHPERWWSLEGDGIVEIQDPIFDTTFEITATQLADRRVLVARDVGEQRRLYGRLVHADKLAAVGVLAAGVAHEINNPTAFVTSNLTELRRYVQAYESVLSEVTAIALECGHADRVRHLLHDGEVGFARREAQSAIGESLQGMERIRKIVANLRSLARRDQAGEPAEPVALSEVIDTVARTAAKDLRAAHARVEVEADVWVLGHRGELVDVVLNLVANAIQARAVSRPNHIAIALRREHASAVIRVSDAGKGIAPADVKRLFEPFFTTKGPGEGTGLGLSLARNIILAHGGSIDVETELGVGSTFTVRLPALEADARAAGEPVSLAGAHVQRRS